MLRRGSGLYVETQLYEKIKNVHQSLPLLSIWVIRRDTLLSLLCSLVSRCERMKLTFRDISAKDGAGKVRIIPEEPEDMWHIYNLVMSGDMVRTTTFRKVRLPLFLLSPILDPAC